jgi:hypothetical protein
MGATTARASPGRGSARRRAARARPARAYPEQAGASRFDGHKVPEASFVERAQDAQEPGEGVDGGGGKEVVPGLCSVSYCE